jgi:hypothetical protein
MSTSILCSLFLINKTDSLPKNGGKNFSLWNKKGKTQQVTRNQAPESSEEFRNLSTIGQSIFFIYFA